MSEHSAHMTPLPVVFRAWLWWYTRLLLLFWCSGIGMRFSNRKEPSCLLRWDQDSPADWMPSHKHTELSRNKQNLNSIVSSYDERAFSPLDTYIHTCHTKAYHTIHTYLFNLYALVQGNVIKPTKGSIDYRGPSGDRTFFLQTEATPPAASCLVRSFHATNIVPKIHNPSDMGEVALDKWQPVWNTQVSISTPVCVNFELHHGSGKAKCWICLGKPNKMLLSTFLSLIHLMLIWDIWIRRYFNNNFICTNVSWKNKATVVMGSWRISCLWLLNRCHSGTMDIKGEHSGEKPQGTVEIFSKFGSYWNEWSND